MFACHGRWLYCDERPSVWFNRRELEQAPNAPNEPLEAMDERTNARSHDGSDHAARGHQRGLQRAAVGGSLQLHDRRVRDAASPSNLAQRVTALASSKRLPPLVRRQLRRATRVNSASLRSSASLARARLYLSSRALNNL
jgi:hypothetical protein